MFLQFLSKFENISEARSMLNALEDITIRFSEDYIKDPNAKDAMIDSLIEYLQSIKGK